MNNMPQLMHKLKTAVFYTVAAVVIVIALAVSGLRLLLTTANLYQQEVEQLASTLLEQPVNIGSMDARLSGLVPTLIFRNVKLLSATQKPLLELYRIDVGLSLDALLFKREIVPLKVTIKALDLQITRTVEGRYKIKGLDLDALLSREDGNRDTAKVLDRLLLQKSELAIEDSTIIWRDEQRAGLTWFFSDIDVLLKKNDQRYQLLLSGKLPKSLGNKLELALDLQGEADKPADWQVRSYIKTHALNLQALQAYIPDNKVVLHAGIVDMELWVDWDKQRLSRFSGDVAVDNLSYQLQGKQRVKLKQVSALFDSRHNGNNIWNISVEQLNYQSAQQTLQNARFSLLAGYRQQNIETLLLNAEKLKLEALSKIVVDMHLLQKQQEKKLQAMALQGDVQKLSVVWRNHQLEQISSEFSNLSVQAWHYMPHVQGLAGRLNYHNGAGKVSLRSDNAELGFPELFRENFSVRKLQAQLQFFRTGQGIQVDVERLLTETGDVTAESVLSLWIPKDDTSPYMDLQTYISEGNIVSIPKFLPVTIMDKELVQWLDKAFVKGRVKQGVVIYNGSFDAFPFSQGEGSFSVDVAAEDFTLHYQKGWPNITSATIDAAFTGQGMRLQLEQGKAEGSRLYQAVAEIPDFSNAVLKLDINAEGKANDTLRFLVNSPVLHNAREVAENIKLAGKVKTRLSLSLPLSEHLAAKQPLRYQGESRLDNIVMSMLDRKIELRQGKGVVYFNEKGLSSKGLQAMLLEQPTKMQLVSDNKAITLKLRGKMQPGNIMQRFAIPGGNKVSGETFYRASLRFPSASKQLPRLRIKTNLLGVRSRLPEFLGKTADRQQDMIFLTWFKPRNRAILELVFSGKGSAVAEMDHNRDTPALLRAAVSFSANKAALPRRNILFIDGAIERFTPEKWQDILGAAEIRKNSYLHTMPIVFNLDKLHVITAEKKTGKTRPTVLDPASVPLLEGIVKKLYVNTLFLGRIDLKTSRDKDGLRIDELMLSARNMKVLAQGNWQQQGRKQQTRLNLTLSSPSFGGMLKDLGFAVVIHDGKTRSVAKLSWPGGPHQFALQKMNADIQLNIEGGTIRKLDAGAGRLLGLFSLTAMPRKLVGDFKDTVKEGFPFDKAGGRIHIEDGDAFTDDFSIQSSVATIAVSGRTGLIAQDYENVVEVTPDITGGVAGVTALLVNLPAGIGLWILDKVTGEKFNKASTETYEITGTWEKPEIVKLQVETEEPEEE